MQELSGSILKTIREERHIPLEQVASSTHIRIELLQDLEDEEYDSIASQAQKKGFIKLYSEFLQLTPQEIKNYLSQAEKAAAPAIEPPKPASAAQEGSEVEVNLSALPAEQNQKPQISIIRPIPEAKDPQPAKPKTGFLMLGKAKTADDQIKFVEGSRAQNILKEIGQKLTERRRYLNIPWELITEQTHMHKDHLQALERGDLGYFSNSMQAKGCLQSYAQFLNLDKDSILFRFAEALQLHRLETSKKPQKTYSEPKVLSPVTVALKKFFTLDLFFGSFLIVGMLAFLIWGMARMATIRSTVLPQTPLPDLAQVLAETPLPVSTELPNNETEIAANPAPSQPAEAIPTPTPLYEPIVSDDPIRLVIIPSSTEWVRLTVDGEIVFTGRLSAGKALQYTAKEGVLLETGNAAAYNAILNDQKYTGFGPIGTIAKVNFTANGANRLDGQPLLPDSSQPVTAPSPLAPEPEPTPTTLP
ncbi:MAG: helix-turn-helix domain-containing protein [Anaerolineaceae bacterium]|nr:helix-turn-helix domain-containing protein [Anaerolineaceae bacterium]